jgi:hypothetical protein
LKKFWSLLLSIIILSVPLSAQAMPSPLSRVSSNVRINEDSTMQIISYEAYHKIEANNTKTSVTLILKNTGDEALSRFTMGIPSHFLDETIQVNELVVYMDGVQQRITSRRTTGDSSFNDLPRKWLTWRFDVEPKEHKVIEFSYVTENPITDKGSHMVYLSLDFLKAWVGTPHNIQFTLDFGDAKPYIFDPNPSFLPHDYDGRGRLTWQYSNSYPPAAIQVYYRSIDKLASDYLNSQAANDRLIGEITEAFSSKAYDKVISLVDQYLEAGATTPLKYELLYLKALSHQGLYQHNEAIALFNQLDNQPIFVEWEESFRNRIIYDKYTHMISTQTTGVDLYTFLNSAKNYVMSNAVFTMWLEKEISSIEPPPTPEPTPIPTDTESSEANESASDSKNDELITSVIIGGYEIAVEIVFIGILVIIILLVIIFRRKKRRRNRGYLFR